MGDVAAALEQFAEAVRLQADLPEARMNLGVLLMKQERRAEAMEQFGGVLAHEPDNQTARKLLRDLGGNTPRESP